MRCPFLREAQVKFCRASAYRKMIVRLSEQNNHERCSSPEYIHCSAAKQHWEEHPSIDHCPFLHESLVQYCSAAAVTKYIPYSESLNSRCGTESHAYCELFLSLSQPHTADIPAADPLQTTHHDVHRLHDIPTPLHLFYSPNHMWMDVGREGICHIGVDAFVTRTLGSAEQITFVTTAGTHQPAISLLINGVTIQFLFPVHLSILRANTYVRSHPEKIFMDPYTVGWLFEVTAPSGHSPASIVSGLKTGAEAKEWMQSECDRVTSFAHELSSVPETGGSITVADGGEFRTGFVRQLNRSSIVRLYCDFFSPLTQWK